MILITQAYLCNYFDLNPLEDGVIISHKEGYYSGIASGHEDPSHLWEQLGMTEYNMDNFRKSVKNAMPIYNDCVEVKTAEPVKLSGKNDEEKIWNYLYNDIKNDYGVAGLMGNLFAESSLISYNLQNSFNKKLNCTD